jgi:hypothetical protein
MSPARFTPEKQCYTVLILQFFLGADIKSHSVSDTFGTSEAGQPLEELVEIQALSIDLREAVMACLSGGGSPAVGLLRSWSSGLKIWAFALRVAA